MAERDLKIEKTFGLGVLLKLTKTSVQGISISSRGDKFVSNVGMKQLSRAVEATLKLHNITLKCR